MKFVTWSCISMYSVYIYIYNDAVLGHQFIPHWLKGKCTGYTIWIFQNQDETKPTKENIPHQNRFTINGDIWGNPEFIPERFSE